jgi:hypothetical protein
MAIELGEHQLTALEKMHNGSVLRGGVGSGKSRAALAYFTLKVVGGTIKPGAYGEYHPPTQPRDLYIITTAKKRDKLEWEKEAVPFRFSTDPTISAAEIKLTVDSWNNIGNYADIKGAFFIFDEQRLVGAGSWVKAFLKIAKENEWIMLSATPGDTWMDYAPLFVANGFYKNRTEFMREHVVYSRYSRYPKIDRFIGVGRLAKRRSQILVDMPLEKHTVRHDVYLECSYGKALFDLAVEDRWHVYENRPINDISDLLSVLRRIVNSDNGRTSELLRLAGEHDRLIIFYNFDYELEILRKLQYLLEIPLAEWNGHKHEEIPDSDRWIYLVQYTAGSEAWNCVLTDTVVFYSLNYSWRTMEQCKGRIDRMNTKYVDLWYYILYSDSMIDKAIRKRLNQKLNFNEKIFERSFNERHQESSPDHRRQPVLYQQSV